MKTIILTLAAAEYRLFKATGLVLPLLRLKWKADAQTIQRLLDAQRTEVYCPTISFD